MTKFEKRSGLALALAVFAFGGLACGGGQKGSGSDDLGTTHATSDDTPLSGQDAYPDEMMDAGVPMDAAPPPAPVTFRITNTAQEDLVFSVEKGWQPIIAAWSGEPPKATPILLYPKYCTASCDLAEDAVCPYCPEPETNKERAALEQRVAVVPGESLEVPWDGMVYVYEKARGTQIQQEGKRPKKVRCDCYRTAEPEPNDYTVQVCGLRVTKEAGKRTTYQCIRTAMTLPTGEEPVVIDVEFPQPEDPNKGKGKRKRRR